MNQMVQLACETTVRIICLTDILPIRRLAQNIKNTVKFQQITASIRHVGIIEPLVVYPQPGQEGKYMILDGNVRFAILSELGVESVKCLIALDDEAYTYNHKVNRLTAIQEHFMIMKAVKSGVSESQIASVLNVDVSQIRKKRDLLVGICAEAIELLKGRPATSAVFGHLRKVHPMRQIEMAELMVAVHNFSDNYARCLVAATPADQTVDKDSSREGEVLSPIDTARMEKEMESLSKDFKQIEESHGKNVLNLVVVIGYWKSILDNGKLVGHLAASYPEVLSELQKLVNSRFLETDIAIE
jgi:hypothetical protein